MNCYVEPQKLQGVDVTIMDVSNDTIWHLVKETLILKWQCIQCYFCFFIQTIYLSCLKLAQTLLCFCRFLMTVLCLMLLEKKCTNAILMPSVLISNQVETSLTLAGVQKLTYSFRYNLSPPQKKKNTKKKQLFLLHLWFKKILHSQEEQFWYLCLLFLYHVIYCKCFVPFNLYVKVKY